MGIDRESFYVQNGIVILPMGFCFPGTGESGDLPPRQECAATCRKPLLHMLGDVQLTMVIVQYAMECGSTRLSFRIILNLLSNAFRIRPWATRFGGYASMAQTVSLNLSFRAYPMRSKQAEALRASRSNRPCGVAIAIALPREVPSSKRMIRIGSSFRKRPNWLAIIRLHGWLWTMCIRAFRRTENLF